LEAEVNGRSDEGTPLTGEVISQSRRAQVEKVASTVPNVQQVVNELQVKDQEASTTPTQ
jgi:osmotically-inducible protein OsmY